MLKILLMALFIFPVCIASADDTSSVFLYNEEYSRSYIPDINQVYGVGFRDLNGDNLPDIYVVSYRGSNRLLMNQGAYRPFKDVTELADLSGILRPEGVFSAELGVTTFDLKFGVALPDINNDGLTDILIAGWGISTALYQNNGDLRFTNITDNLNFIPPINANACTVADINCDGLLDIFLTDERYGSRLLINLGEGIFEDISNQSGVQIFSKTSGAGFCDLNGDMLPDLYVCDGIGPDFIYRNLGNGRFTQMHLPIEICTDSLNSAGISFGDIDNDGDVDLFVTVLKGPNYLYLNETMPGDSLWVFTNVTLLSNLYDLSDSYGSVIADFNNDCWPDIFITNNGYNRIYVNNKNGTFSEQFQHKSHVKDFSTGCASSDFDLDGDLDLFVANIDKNSILLRNITDNNHFIKLKIIGITSNRDAIGAHIRLFKSGHIEELEYLIGTREITGGNGYLSFSDPVVHFGLDTINTVDAKIFFPSGTIVTEKGLMAGNTYEIYEYAALSRTIIQFFQQLFYLMHQTVFWYQVMLVILFFMLMWFFIRMGLQRYKWTAVTVSSYLGGFFLMALILIIALRKLGVIYIFLSINILTVVFALIFSINSERLYKLRQIRERYRSVLIELNNRIVNIHDDELLFNTVVEYLYEKTEFKGCCVVAYLEDKNEFSEYFSKNKKIPIAQLNSQKSFTDLITLLKTKKYVQRPDFKKYSDVFELLGSEIVISIDRNDCLYGLLSLGAPPPVPILVQEEIELYKSISIQMAITIENNEYIRRSNEMIKKLTEAEVREKYLNELETANKSLDGKNRELQKLYDELKNTQTQLIHSEKMASLGQLVAGISHELNNPIGFIYANVKQLKNYINTIQKFISDNNVKQKGDADSIQSVVKSMDKVFPDIQNLIADTIHGSQMVKELVDNLRSFSHLDQAQWKEIDIHEGIESSLMILRPELKDRIKIHKNYMLNTLIECKPGQLNQVFMNILSNAAQAIEDEGNIWIETDEDEKNIYIRIKDDGKGIPAEIKEKIFDPFFTTKDVGKGMGLGLSISYSIIKNHNGRIEVESDPGKGSIFKIQIPLHPVKLD